VWAFDKLSPNGEWVCAARGFDTSARTERAVGPALSGSTWGNPVQAEAIPIQAESNPFGLSPTRSG